MPETIDSPEARMERTLNEREVFNKFEQILAGRDFKEISKAEDEAGLVAWHIETVDEDGDCLDISYHRGKVFPDGLTTLAAITRGFYLPDGTPCGGNVWYEHVEGEWIERN